MAEPYSVAFAACLRASNHEADTVASLAGLVEWRQSTTRHAQRGAQRSELVSRPLIGNQQLMGRSPCRGRRGRGVFFL